MWILPTQDSTEHKGLASASSHPEVSFSAGLELSEWKAMGPCFGASAACTVCHPGRWTPLPSGRSGALGGATVHSAHCRTGTGMNLGHGGAKSPGRRPHPESALHPMFRDPHLSPSGGRAHLPSQAGDPTSASPTLAEMRVNAETSSWGEAAGQWGRVALRPAEGQLQVWGQLCSQLWGLHSFAEAVNSFPASTRHSCFLGLHL